jgi:hypothetical protein
MFLMVKMVLLILFEPILLPAARKTPFLNYFAPILVLLGLFCRFFMNLEDFRQFCLFFYLIEEKPKGQRGPLFLWRKGDSGGLNSEF